jgi:SAM-dependent methyltransferase
VVPVKPDWYRPNGNESFFGPFYYQGDHSREGYLSEREFSSEERTVREVDGVIRLLDLEPRLDLRILDAPCGYGRHLEELARRGYSVAGVDLCPAFVESARWALQRIGSPADVHEGELRRLPFPDESFDVALNLFYSIGFYPEDQDNLQSIAELARVLRRRGRLLLHTDVNLARIHSGLYNQPWQRRLVDGSLLRIFERFDPESRRMIGEWVIQNERSIERRGYSMRVYSLEEFSEMCRKFGLEIEAVFGSFDPGREEYTDASEELIFIARKL